MRHAPNGTLVSAIVIPNPLENFNGVSVTDVLRRLGYGPDREAVTFRAMVISGG